MNHRTEIQIDLIKLINGERLLRLTYAPLGLAIEKKLDAKQALLRQKKQLLGMFEEVLAKADLQAA